MSHISKVLQHDETDCVLTVQKKYKICIKNTSRRTDYGTVKLSRENKYEIQSKRFYAAGCKGAACCEWGRLL